eukprot:542390_1
MKPISFTLFVAVLPVLILYCDTTHGPTPGPTPGPTQRQPTYRHLDRHLPGPTPGPTSGPTPGPTHGPTTTTTTYVPTSGPTPSPTHGPTTTTTTYVPTYEQTHEPTHGPTATLISFEVINDTAISPYNVEPDTTTICEVIKAMQHSESCTNWAAYRGEGKQMQLVDRSLTLGVAGFVTGDKMTLKYQPSPAIQIL